MKRLIADHALITCRVVSLDGADSVVLKGSRAGVDAAATAIADLIALQVSRMTKASGYKPLFSALFLVPPPGSTASSAMTFTRVPITEEVQMLLDMYEPVSPLHTFTLKASGSPPPVRSMAFALGKKLAVVGYDVDAIASYVRGAYDALAASWASSEAFVLRLSVGKTYLQSRPWPANETLSVGGVCRLQSAVRHQFCSSVLTEAHVARAHTWADSRAFTAPETSRLLSVHVVHMSTGSNLLWTADLDDENNLVNEEEASVSGPESRLGFVSVLQLDDGLLGHRLEFRKQTEVDEGLGGDLGELLMAVYEPGTAWQLPADSPYQVDRIMYHVDTKRCDLATGLILYSTQTDRFAGAAARTGRLWSVSLINPILDLYGVATDADTFVDGVLAVASAGVDLVAAMNAC
ncbi:hypothetical protein ACHHYP_11777 [Achlya hypogyna]|uniref:Uncharacterized protein n=1 Tax=Achlya hypogyna TaxID=1202772 RepID=A0A1V9YID9_ACHHY|nr:hypothetical protein ACHHYP_11777 [Achlya hypogyna]